MSVNILNLPQYRVERVEETHRDYHVFAETAHPRMVCDCGSRSIAGWGAHEQVLRDLPMHGKRVAIYVRARRFRCDDCGKTGFERLPATSGKRQMTSRLENWVGQQSIKRTFTSIADETGLDEKTVRNIFRDYVTDLEAELQFEAPKWLGIDEIHIIRPRCVVANNESKTIGNLEPDRKKRTVTSYVHALADREKVKFVAMDMWTPYRDAAAVVLPQATVIVDKFHVLRMANAAIPRANTHYMPSTCKNQGRENMKKISTH